MARKKAQELPNESMGCLIFGLFLVGVGVLMAKAAVTTLSWWLDTRNLEEVPARILSVELANPAPVPNRGDLYPERECIAQYAYKYKDQYYTGTRITIGRGSSDQRLTRLDVYNEIVPYRNSGNPFRCFVNPRDPADSGLYRVFPWERLSLLSAATALLGGIGLNTLLAVSLNFLEERRIKKLRAKHTGKPWLWRREWEGGVIHARGRGTTRFTLALTTCWNVIAVPISYFIIADVVFGEGDRAALLPVFLFLCVGLLTAVWAAYAVVKEYKARSSVFRMAEMPGVIGGTLSGAVEVPAKVRSKDGFLLTLSCIRWLTTGEERDRETRKHILWQDVYAIEAELLNDDPETSSIPVTSVPVMFTIPSSYPQTKESNGKEQVTWRLEVQAKTPGLDFRAQFEVPVFQRKAGTSDSMPGDGVQPAGIEESDADDL